MANKDKPNGFYNEIANPYERKEEVKSLFKDLQIIEHNNAEPDYKYLYDEEFFLEIVNPYGDDNLCVEFAGAFTLFFGGWHMHYDFYEYDYGIMKKVAAEIINNNYGAMCFYADGKWKLSTLLEEKATSSSNPIELIKKAHSKEYFDKYLKQKKVTIDITYWRPEDNCKYTIEPKFN